MLEFTCLLYVYKLIVSDKVKFYRIKELKDLFVNESLDKLKTLQFVFVEAGNKNNDLIQSNYEFACKVISSFF